MSFNPDESQKHALLTWYNLDHSLHFDARHPAIALAGEAGELLDLFKKHEYKPNFNWMNCICGNRKEVHEILDSGYKCKGIYTPLILDELGDYSYYLRILAYQKGISFEELCEDFNDYGTKSWYLKNDLLGTLGDMLLCSGQLFSRYLDKKEIVEGRLTDCIFYFLAILSKLDTTLDTVLELNYKKLNSEPTNHGWKNAKMKTIADCPPMNPK